MNRLSLSPRSLPSSAAVLFSLAFALSACSGAHQATPAPAPAPAPGAQSAALRIAERYRVAAITTRRFTPEAYWRIVGPLVAKPGFRTEEIGRSLNGRPIRAVTFGEGKTTVLLWSQMHGDEATATMALADIFRFLGEATGDSVRERLRRGLRIVAVPMLNPDGAEHFQRRNAAAIDINRDARRLATPEGRALKALRDRLSPAFGFNLHDQNARTRVGRDGKQAAIALLAPAFSEDRSYNAVRTRARLLAAAVAQTLAPEIPGRIAKYDDTFNVRAFGDNMQRWGTSTILIESGALPDDPQKQRLRALNVVAILSALDAIATGRYERADPAAYDTLPFNATDGYDLLVRGGRLVLPHQAPVAADLAIDYEDAVAHTGPIVRDVGDLSDAVAVDTIDATGLFLHPVGVLAYSDGEGTWLRLGAPATIEIRRGADRTSALVRRIGHVR
ncbi:MAG: peptidase M14 [Gemmatimonadaceae bacterium]|nr:peptidase M14 [Gemmatimonadaceae bacterium]